MAKPLASWHAPMVLPLVLQPLNVAPPLTVGTPDRVTPVGRLSAMLMAAVVGPLATPMVMR